jgi:hypothetical protein
MEQTKPGFILKQDQSYTFSNIFDLKFETDEILAELGYQYQIVPLELPHYPLSEPNSLDQLRKKMRSRLPLVPLTNETARREFYITPVLFAALDEAKFKLSIEYRVIGQRLRGEVDYLLRGTTNVVVVEAKQADIERGFTQLAAEMIALADYFTSPPNPIYGIVTTGDLWRFGVLDSVKRTISKDIEEYLLPRDLEPIFSILLGLLKDKET